MQPRDQHNLTKEDREYLQQAGAAVYQAGQNMLARQGHGFRLGTESKKRPAEADVAQPNESGHKKRRINRLHDGAGTQQQMQGAIQPNPSTQAHLQRALAEFEALEQKLANWESELVRRQADQEQIDQGLHHRAMVLGNWERELEMRQRTLQETGDALQSRQGELANWQTQLDARHAELQHAQAHLQSRQRDLTHWQARLNAREQQQAQPVMQPVLQIDPEVAAPAHPRHMQDEAVISAATQQETQPLASEHNLDEVEFDWDPFGLLDVNFSNTPLSPRSPAQNSNEAQASAANDHNPVTDVRDHLDVGFDQGSQGYGMMFFSQATLSPGRSPLLGEDHLDLTCDDDFRFQL